jgi:hypothetical protein
MGKRSTVFIAVLAIGLIGLLLPDQSTTSEPSGSISSSAGGPVSSKPNTSISEAVEASTAPTAVVKEPSESQSAEAAVPASERNLLEGLIPQLVVAIEVSDGYDRDLFKHWIDADGDGCNTRKEVLIAEAIVQPVISGDCDLTGGQWYSLYDGVVSNNSSDFDIDHFVPLNEAWQSGAHAWSNERRQDFANDLGFAKSLIAVTASSNRSKSDQDPPNWLPSNADFLCEYLTSWVEVKIRWGLTVDSAELATIKEFGKTCK